MQSLLLYKFFLANQESTISLSRIKAFIEKMNSIKVGFSVHPLYKLLKLGIIERTDNHQFRLSPTCYVYNNRFCIAVNLPITMFEQIVIEPRHSMAEGLFIYEYSPDLLKNDIKANEFSFEKIIGHLVPLRKLVRTFLKRNELFNTSKELYHFEPIQNKWVACQNHFTGENLYKVIVSEFHFYYVYELRSPYSFYGWSCIFERKETEKLNIFKTYLCLNANNSGISYDGETEQLNIAQTFPLPIMVEKIFFINHALATGTFPSKRAYVMTKNDFRKVQRIFNHKINRDHE